MRVLVVGTSTASAQGVEAMFEDAGHEVVRCHDPGEAAFPCAGLAEGRSCPLEGRPVDVTVTARDRPWPRPTELEDGAICALRQHVPLVALGTALDPFDDWVTRGVDDVADLVKTCEEVADLPLRKHTEVAIAAARDVVDHAGFDAAEVSAVVRRRQGRLSVVVDVPESARAHLSNIVAHVTTQLRVFDRHARGIDISSRQASTQEVSP